MLKPGYKTSEYWGTLIISLIVAVAPVLVSYAVLTQEQSQLLIDLAKVVVPIIIPAGIAGAAWLMAQYTKGRNQLKQVETLAKVRTNAS